MPRIGHFYNGNDRQELKQKVSAFYFSSWDNENKKDRIPSSPGPLPCSSEAQQVLACSGIVLKTAAAAPPLPHFLSDDPLCSPQCLSPAGKQDTDALRQHARLPTYNTAQENNVNYHHELEPRPLRGCTLHDLVDYLLLDNDREIKNDESKASIRNLKIRPFVRTQCTCTCRCTVLIYRSAIGCENSRNLYRCCGDTHKRPDGCYTVHSCFWGVNVAVEFMKALLLPVEKVAPVKDVFLCCQGVM